MAETPETKTLGFLLLGILLYLGSIYLNASDSLYWAATIVSAILVGFALVAQIKNTLLYWEERKLDIQIKKKTLENLNKKAKG